MNIPEGKFADEIRNSIKNLSWITASIGAQIGHDKAQEAIAECMNELSWLTQNPSGTMPIEVILKKAIVTIELIKLCFGISNEEHVAIINGQNPSLDPKTN